MAHYPLKSYRCLSNWKKKKNYFIVKFPFVTRIYLRQHSDVPLRANQFLTNWSAHDNSKFVCRPIPYECAVVRWSVPGISAHLAFHLLRPQQSCAQIIKWFLLNSVNVGHCAAASYKTYQKPCPLNWYEMTSKIHVSPANKNNRKYNRNLSKKKKK